MKKMKKNKIYEAAENVDVEEAEILKKKQKKKRDIVFWVSWSIFMFSFLTMHFLFNFSVLITQGNSMLPHYHDKQLCIIANFNYEPEQGDVICFKNENLDRNLIKRVIATEGQTVYIDYKENKVSVDGTIVHDYAKEKMYEYDNYTTSNPFVVPKGCVFVLGDNRNNSIDSRDERVGAVRRADIIGKVYGKEHNA